MRDLASITLNMLHILEIRSIVYVQGDGARAMCAVLWHTCRSHRVISFRVHSLLPHGSQRLNSGLRFATKCLLLLRLLVGSYLHFL